MTVEVMVALDDTLAHLTWWESAWSDYRGWPRTVCYYDNRICYGGTSSQPDTQNWSQRGNYNAMSVSGILNPATAGDGITTGAGGTTPFTNSLASLQVDLIQWMDSEKTMVVGTQGAEWVVGPADISGVFGRDNFVQTVQSRYGSDYRQGRRCGNELMFATKSQHEIKSLVFNYLEQTYSADKVQLLFDEYPKMEVLGFGGNRKFRTFAWDTTRSTLWCVDTTGNLFGLTHDRSLQVNTWHSHQIGGYDPAVSGGSVLVSGDATYEPIYYAPTGSVASLAVIPNPVIGVNDVWMAVKRKINGAWQYQFERMIGEHIAYDSVFLASLGPISNVSGNYYTDASRPVSSVSTPAFVGLNHLEGTVPRGTASNSKGLFTVTGSAVAAGSTTLQSPYPTNVGGEQTIISWGFNFSSIIEPVRIEAGSQVGTAQGAIKRIHEATVRFYRTMAAKVGSSASVLETILFRNYQTPAGKSADLFTGDKLIKLTADYDRDGYMYILQDQPLPFAVASIIGEGMTYD